MMRSEQTGKSLLVSFAGGQTDHDLVQLATAQRKLDAIQQEESNTALQSSPLVPVNERMIFGNVESVRGTEVEQVSRRHVSIRVLTLG
jgi:hypothetical protein